jgi:serine/threonine protein kinase
MDNVHHLNSNLNNVLSKKKHNNLVDFRKLELLLKSKFDSKIKTPIYQGYGSNGEYFVFEKDKEKYICKCIPYSASNLKQIEKELSILYKIQSNKYNLRYINPCIVSFITNDNIINIFPMFKGISLRKLLDLISDNNFDKKSRYIITKYVLKQICKAIYQIHKLGISHRQLDLDSIIIEIPNDLQSSFQDKNNSSIFSKIINTFTPSDNVKISKLQPSKANYNTYKPFYSENDTPLKVKLTNFGYGCGKTISTNNTIQNSTPRLHNYINCYNSTYITSTDPYVSKYVINNSTRLSTSDKEVLGRKYDLWCIGLIILHFILNSNIDVNKLNLNDIKGLDTSSLINEKEFSLYLNNCKKYLLVPIKNRKSSKFVEEKIILDEKYA